MSSDQEQNIAITIVRALFRLLDRVVASLTDWKTILAGGSIFIAYVWLLPADERGSSELVSALRGIATNGLFTWMGWGLFMLTAVAPGYGFISFIAATLGWVRRYRECETSPTLTDYLPSAAT